MASQRELMIAGEPYDPADPELVAERARCREALRRFHAADGEAEGMDVLRGLLGHVGPGAIVVGPLRCDYGWNITLGGRAFLNYDVVILDCGPVAIGEGALVGPGAQLIAADHARDPRTRRSGIEFAAPVTVGDNAWIGAGAIVLPGVTVGADAIVGAGSVVTRDVPPGATVAGSPARAVGPQ